MTASAAVKAEMSWALSLKFTLRDTSRKLNPADFRMSR